MPATVTKNLAQAHRVQFRDNGDGTATLTVWYWVGYRPAAGPVVPLNAPMVQGCAGGISVAVTMPETDTLAQMLSAVTAAIATQEGLSVAAGDSILLSTP